MRKISPLSVTEATPDQVVIGTDVELISLKEKVSEWLVKEYLKLLKNQNANYQIVKKGVWINLQPGLTPLVEKLVPYYCITTGDDSSQIIVDIQFSDDIQSIEFARFWRDGVHLNLGDEQSRIKRVPLIVDIMNAIIVSEEREFYIENETELLTAYMAKGNGYMTESFSSIVPALNFMGNENGDLALLREFAFLDPKVVNGISVNNNIKIDYDDARRLVTLASGN